MVDFFSKIGEIKIWRIGVSKEVNVFQNTLCRYVRILRGNGEIEQNGAVICI